MVWAILILDQLFWSIPMPFVATVVWASARAIYFCLGKQVPAWLHTPWDCLCLMYLRGHGIRIIDTDGDGANTLLVPGIMEFRGAVLANHRSWGDFVMDPYQTHCAVVARIAAVVACLGGGLLGLLCDRIIVINRGRTSRDALKAKCARHDRYLIFPEGTRRASALDKDSPAPLKVGGLKNVWEEKLAALIVITVNKEFVVDEKRGVVSCSTTLFRARHAPILAGEYPSLDTFVDAVEKAWQATWHQAYELRRKHDGSLAGSDEMRTLV
mmetsp:Transcript_33473/g.70435  ORF Transcript_33473/g.70435 Transcript_33473/m.70435 type:complete len:269 (+) Transcript_33473:175-981(+)